MTQKLTEKQLEKVAAYEELRMAHHRSNNKKQKKELETLMKEIEEELNSQGINVNIIDGKGKL